MITRIRELLETRQLTPTQFADLIGVGRPVISHILSERNKPSLEVVQKIIGAFPDVSLPWLLTGTGSMQASAAPATDPVTAPAAPIVPQPAAPTPAYSPQTLQPASNVASIAAPPVRSAQLPLPPKFRPGAKATPQPTVAPLGIAPTPFMPAVSAEAPAPTPVAAPMLEAPAASTSPLAATAPTPIPTPTSVTSFAAASPSDLPAADSLVAGMPTLAHTTPQASAAIPEPAAVTTTNQAAALSFLGEPGKAIRRIVIFYRDGSFSDYVPEGL
jgi:transcriptional regulator with XRE-family HTH domain